jgi:hypothetical protein
MGFAVLFIAFLISAIPTYSQSLLPDSAAYDVTPIAGIENTSATLKDGMGEAVGFGSPTSLWGDGAYLYVADGTALRRIEIATRRVTTITRLAGSGRVHHSTGLSYAGPSGLWGDGSYIYTTDIAEQTVRRVDLSTALVDVVANVPGPPMGLVGNGRYLYVGDSYHHTIDKVDIASSTLAEFVTPPEPLDPRRCWLGSGCIGYFIQSPTSLSIDGDNVYATGFNTTLRIVNTVTGQVTSSPELPFVPTSVWGKNGVLYYTEYAGNRIGKVDLTTGEVSIFFPGDLTRKSNAYASIFSSIWGDDNFLYVIESDHILRVDLATGQLEHFIGKDPTIGSVDGIGNAARFVNASGLYSDGKSLYVVDHLTFSASGSIRKVNLSTAEVTTLPTPPVRAIWGNGESLYATLDESPVRVVRIGPNDGNITTVASLSDVYGGNHIAGDSSFIYVSQANIIERISLDSGTVSSISLWMPDYGGSSIWSDSVNLYVAERDKLVRYCLATGETSDFAMVHGYISTIWGNGESLFVIADSGLWRISMASGEVYPLMRGGTGKDAGNPLNAGGHLWSSGANLFLWGSGENLFLANGSIVYRLTPTAMPPFSSFELPDRAASANTSVSNSNTVTVGSGTIELDASSSAGSGFVIFSRRENGIVVSEATVPATAPIRSGRIYLSIAGSLNTGLAMVNPSDRTATIDFYFTDTNGHNSGSYSFTLPPHGQIARFLNEEPFSRVSTLEFPLPSEGTFTFASSIPVAAIAMRCYTNERSEFLITSMPVLDLSVAASQAPAVIPHFAQGGGWTTSVVAINPTDRILQGNFESYADNGTLLATDSYTIQPRSSTIRQMASSAAQSQTGWIRVVPASSTSTPGCMSIFSFQEGGITVTIAGSASDPPNTSFRLYYEFDGSFRTGAGNTVGTGVAIVNPSDHTATIYFEPTSVDGFPLSQEPPSIGSLTLPARGHRSLYLNEINPYYLPSNGVFRIWTDSPEGISVIGSRGRYNERKEYLIGMMPPTPESSDIPLSPTCFPHIVAGGGYSTEVVILGSSPGRGISGKVRYFSQSGAPMPVQTIGDVPPVSQLDNIMRISNKECRMQKLHGRGNTSSFDIP